LASKIVCGDTTANRHLAITSQIDATALVYQPNTVTQTIHLA